MKHNVIFGINTPGVTPRVFGNELCSTYYSSVYAQCLSIVKDRNTAADLSQDIFLKVLQKAETFREEAKLSTWLFSITHNHCMDYLRKKRHSVQLENYSKTVTNVIFEDPNDETHNYENVFDTTDLKAALLKLPESDRYIIISKYLSKKSIKQIAKELNIGESAVKMRLQRARAKIALIRVGMSKSAA